MVPPLKLLSSMATREMLAEIALRYERDTARAVAAEAAGGVEVARRLQGGETADVVVLAASAIDELTAAGHLLEGSRVDLVRSGIAIAVRAGSPEPDIATEAALRKAVLEAGTLSYSTGPSGVYLEGLFERWGILGQIRARIIVPPPGVPVGSLVAQGAVGLGFQQQSELMHIAGITVIGPLPPEIQSLTMFAGAIGAACSDPAAARALLAFAASPAVADVRQRHGMAAP